MAVCKKIKHIITIKPSNCLYSREIKSTFTQRNKVYVHSETCTGMFIETLIIVANCKQNTNVLQWVNGQTNDGTSIPQDTTQQWTIDIHNNLDEPQGNYAE